MTVQSSVKHADQAFTCAALVIVKGLKREFSLGLQSIEKMVRNGEVGLNYMHYNSALRLRRMTGSAIL